MAISETAAQELERVLAQYGDLLFRVCLLTLDNRADAEDGMQETLLKYLCHAPAFRDSAHEKAWLIRVAMNCCRDLRRAQHRREKYEREMAQGAQSSPAEEEGGPLLEALYTLPEKFRTVLFLHYVEEYKVSEVAAVLGISVSAVKMRLQKGRKLLEEAYRRGNGA